MSFCIAHPVEELLEEYCFSRVSEPALSALEEHLLVCEVCQQRVENLDAEIAGLKSAMASLPQATDSTPFRDRWHGSLWVPQLPSLAIIGVAAGLLLLSGISVAHRSVPTGQPVPVELQGFRGSAPAVLENGVPVPRQRPLKLTMDSAIEGASPSQTKGYRLEVVDHLGQPKWSGTPLATDHRLTAQIQTGLAAGQYWVRLYTVSDSVLLREFALRVE